MTHTYHITIVLKHGGVVEFTYRTNSIAKVHHIAMAQHPNTWAAISYTIKREAA